MSRPREAPVVVGIRRIGEGQIPGGAFVVIVGMVAGPGVVGLELPGTAWNCLELDAFPEAPPEGRGERQVVRTRQRVPHRDRPVVRVDPLPGIHRAAVGVPGRAPVRALAALEVHEFDVHARRGSAAASVTKLVHRGERLHGARRTGDRKGRREAGDQGFGFGHCHSCDARSGEGETPTQRRAAPVSSTRGRFQFKEHRKTCRRTSDWTTGSPW